MKLYIINKVNDNEVINYVYKTEDEAYKCFKDNFIGEEDKDGDSLCTCFCKYKGARFKNYRLEYSIVEL